MWTEVEKLREANRLSERATAALFDAALGLRVRNTDYRAQLRGWGEEVSDQLASNDLRAMVNAGLLLPRGRNRAAHYEAAEPLVRIRAGARADRRPIDTSGLFAPGQASNL